MADLVINQEAKCNTCRAIFSCIEKAKEHYKGDWHIFNSKRRANNLVPLSKEEFKKALPLINSKKKVAPSSPQSKTVANSMPIKFDQNASSGSFPIDSNESTSRTALMSDSSKLDSSDSAAETDAGTDFNNEGSDASGEGNEVDVALPVGPHISIFDNAEFESVDDCVEYMAVKFGFFIPDIEYLVDRDLLLQYLGEKVKLGGICLYCQKQLRPGRPCQNHMISKSHCKIAYEEGIDADEFEDFYDFTSSYDGVDEEYDEDGNLVEKTLEVSPIGELILTSGRVVGHRAFRLFYKQKFRPVDDRPSVMAQQREELLRLGSLQFGGSKVSADEVGKLSDLQVMSLLVKQQREIRKSQIVQQRWQMKRAMIDQRREYKSTVDKLRSSATTTAKIRDYHKTIM